MNSKIVSLAFVSAMLLLAAVLSFIGPVEAHPEIIVPDDYPTIQAAVDAAIAGDTILVASGTYYEHVVIATSLTLKGAGSEITIIDANGTSHGIHVKANNVHISGFTIQNGQFNWGIYLYMTYGTVIKDNVVKDNLLGIYVDVSTTNTITNNMITSNQHGILAYSSSGNVIADNIITSTPFYCIDLYGGSSDNSIYGNTISNNLYYDSCGIRIEENAHDNIVYHNNFINNTCQVEIPVGYGTIWDDGYPSSGNYWSDQYHGGCADHFSGPGQNISGSDGIVDDPYVIDANNTDRYPLMYQWQDITSPTTIDDYDGLWHTTDFMVTLNATDDKSGVKATYYKINDAPTKTVSTDGQPLITTDDANNTLEYWSIDNAGNEEIPHKILTGIKLDKTAPTGSIIINSGDAYTTSTSVTLTLNATDDTSGVYQVRYANDPLWDTEPWETHSPTKAWNLTSGDGTKTVYYQIKDNAGLNETYSDSIFLDATKPFIGSPSQEPPESQVQPDQKVTVSVEVTDGQSGVREVILQYRYSIDGGQTWTTWKNVPMDKTMGDTYEGEIPELPDGTRVQYGIAAYDNADNVATKDQLGQYYIYTVIPEFPTWTAILATLCILPVALILLRRNYNSRRVPEGRIF